MKSNIEKARETAEKVEAWAKELEASGRTAMFLRGGVLNKSLVSATLGFSRSLWQSNAGLKEIADRLDKEWGTELSKSDLISKVDKFILDLDGAAPPNDGTAMLLSVVLSEAGLTAGQYQRHKVIREKLEALAVKHDLQLAKAGHIAPDEANAGLDGIDPLDMVPASRLRDVQMRLSQSERKNAELRAENAHLRAQIDRRDEVAELIAMGGRIGPGAT